MSRNLDPQFSTVTRKTAVPAAQPDLQVPNQPALAVPMAAVPPGAAVPVGGPAVRAAPRAPPPPPNIGPRRREQPDLFGRLQQCWMQASCFPLDTRICCCRCAQWIWILTRQAAPDDSARRHVVATSSAVAPQRATVDIAPWRRACASTRLSLCVRYRGAHRVGDT